MRGGSLRPDARSMAATEELAVPESSLGLRVMVRPLRRSALDRSAKTLFLHALRKKKAGILGFPVNSGLYRTCLELQVGGWRLSHRRLIPSSGANFRPSRQAVAPQSCPLPPAPRANFHSLHHVVHKKRKKMGRIRGSLGNAVRLIGYLAVAALSIIRATGSGFDTITTCEAPWMTLISLACARLAMNGKVCGGMFLSWSP